MFTCLCKIVSNIYKFTNNKWTLKNKCNRKLDSVFVDPEIKEELVELLQDFELSKSWHTDKQIPYKLGVLTVIKNY